MGADFLMATVPMALAETPPAIVDSGLTTENITEATSNIFTVVGQTLTQVVSEPVFLMFLVSGLIFMSIRIIRGLKRG